MGSFLFYKASIKLFPDRSVSAMFNFPTFAELEAKRDKINSEFHHNTKPVLVDRLQQFGFQLVNEEAPGIMQLTEQAT